MLKAVETEKILEQVLLIDDYVLTVKQATDVKILKFGQILGVSRTSRETVASPCRCDDHHSEVGLLAMLPLLWLTAVGGRVASRAAHDWVAVETDPGDRKTCLAIDLNSLLPRSTSSIYGGYSDCVFACNVNTDSHSTALTRIE